MFFFLTRETEGSSGWVFEGFLVGFLLDGVGFCVGEFTGSWDGLDGVNVLQM